MTDRSFLERVRHSLDSLHPAERRLANFLLDFPGELAAYTAQELAALANVSSPTVSRYIKRLGYSSYEEARRHVRAARKTGAALYMVASNASGLEAQIHAQIEQAQANIVQTLAAIPAKEIDALGTALLAARRVWVVGFRTSHAFASYFHTQIHQVCPDVTLMPSAGQTLAEQIASVSAEDCVIVFGLARRPQGFERILAALRGRTQTLAYVSDEKEDFRPNLAWHMRCATLAPGPLYGHVSVMMLLHILASRVIQLSQQDGRKRLAEIEDLHRELDEL